MSTSTRRPGNSLNQNIPMVPLPVKSSSSFSSSQKTVVVAPPIAEVISRGGPSPLPESVVYTGAQLLKLPFTRTGAPEARSFRVFRAQNAPGDASFQDGDGSSDFGPDELYLGYRKPLGAKKSSFLGGLASMAGVGNDKSADRWTLHPLSSMSWVRRGDSSPNFQRNRAKGGLRGVDSDCCFTVMGPERSLDVICSSAEEAEEWCAGIHAAIRTAKGAKMSSNTNSRSSSSSSTTTMTATGTKLSNASSREEQERATSGDSGAATSSSSNVKNRSRNLDDESELSSSLSSSTSTSTTTQRHTSKSMSSSAVVDSLNKNSAPAIDTAVATASSAPAALQAAYDVSVWDDSARASYFSQALKDAVTKKRPDEVLLAFSEGCDPSLCVDDETGDNALTFACAINAPTIVRVCLENSVPFMPWGADGPDALHIAAMSGSEACVVEIMTVAENSPGHVAFILARAEPVTGNTSLHAACAGGFGGVAAALLLKGGLELTAVNNQYRTPLHLASMCKPPSSATGGGGGGGGVRGNRFRDYVATVQVLIEFGAEATLSWGDEQGDTALHLATAAGSPSIVEVLLATLSVNPLIINPISKLSPLQVARNKEKEKNAAGAGKVAATEVLKLLEEYAAMPTVAKQGEVALIGGVQSITNNNNNYYDGGGVGADGVDNVDDIVDEEVAALRDAGFTTSSLGGGFSAFTVGSAAPAHYRHHNHHHGGGGGGDESYHQLAATGAANHLNDFEFGYNNEGGGGGRSRSEVLSDENQGGGGVEEGEQHIQSMGIQVYPWQQLFGVSPEDGQTYPYWWNCETGESSWEAPTHVQAYLNAIRDEANLGATSDLIAQVSSAMPSNTTDDPRSSHGSDAGDKSEGREKVEKEEEESKSMTDDVAVAAAFTSTTGQVLTISQPVPQLPKIFTSSSSSSSPTVFTQESVKAIDNAVDATLTSAQTVSQLSTATSAQAIAPQYADSQSSSVDLNKGAPHLLVASPIIKSSSTSISSSSTASATVSVTTSVLSAVLGAAASSSLSSSSSSSSATLSKKSSTSSENNDVSAASTTASPASAISAIAPVTTVAAVVPAPPQKAAPPAASSSAPLPAMTTETFEKYSRMLKMGVPREAVVQKLLKDGATKEDISAFSTYVDSGAAAAAVATSAAATVSSQNSSSGTSEAPEEGTSVDMSMPKRSTAEIQKDALASLQADPKFDKYLKMKKMGVPLGAIKAKLTEEGFSIEDQTLFLSAFASPSVLESMGLQAGSGGGSGGGASGDKNISSGGGGGVGGGGKGSGAETRKLTAPTLKLHWDPLKLDSAAHAKSLWGRLQMQGGGGGGESKSNGEEDEVDGADAAVISLESDDLDMLALLFAAPQNGKGTSINSNNGGGRRNGEGGSTISSGGGGGGSVGSGDSTAEGESSTISTIPPSLVTGPPISLLDGKRASNINIVLAQFRRFPSNLSIATAVYKRDATLLPKDMLEKLSSVLPTADEAAMFKKELPRLKANGEDGRLVEADKWFAFVSTIPRFSSIVAAALTVMIFEQQASDLVERTKILSQACAQVTRSTRLQSVMSCVLSIGNALNAGHASLSGATAISLDSLLKLTSTRAADKKTSLMDALVMLCERKALKQVAAGSNSGGGGGSAAVKPEMQAAALNPLTVDERRQSMLAWTDDVIGLQSAARVDVNELRSDAAKLKAAVNVVKTELASEEKRIAEEEEEEEGKKARNQDKGPSEESKSEEGSGGEMSSYVATASASSEIDPRQAMLNQLLKGRGGGGGGGSGGVKAMKGSNTSSVTLHPISIDDRRRFVASLRKFVSEASGTLTVVDAEVVKASASAADLAVYFGEPSTIGVSKVFSVLTEFAGGFNGSLSALRRKRASEAKSEVKGGGGAGGTTTPSAKNNEKGSGGVSSSNNPPPLPKGPPPSLGSTLKGGSIPSGRPPTMVVKK